MDSIISVLQSAWRYIMLVRITDMLDVAIMSFAIYKLLSLVRSTRAENIFKGIVIFIVALWLSFLLNLQSQLLPAHRQSSDGCSAGHQLYSQLRG